MFQIAKHYRVYEPHEIGLQDQLGVEVIHRNQQVTRWLLPRRTNPVTMLHDSAGWQGNFTVAKAHTYELTHHHVCQPFFADNQVIFRFIPPGLGNEPTFTAQPPNPQGGRADAPQPAAVPARPPVLPVQPPRPARGKAPDHIPAPARAHPVDHQLDCIRFQEWLQRHFTGGAAWAVHLFEEGNGNVALDQAGRLKRSNRMEAAYGKVIEDVGNYGFFCGIVYLMYWLNECRIIPLYVGKAERFGKNGQVSANITTNRGTFGRWGHSRYYHIGDLTDALQGVQNSHTPWIPRLFINPANRTLRQPTYFGAITWTHAGRCPCGHHVDVVSLENCLIRHCQHCFPNENLNAAGNAGGCRCPR